MFNFRKPKYPTLLLLSLLGVLLFTNMIFAAETELKCIPYNNPGLTVDLGVGLWAWPLPMDYDNDGDLDMVVSCTDKPQDGVFLFENTEGNVPMPVFKPSVKIAPGVKNAQISYIDGKPRILQPGVELINFKESGFTKEKEIFKDPDVFKLEGRIRANQWKYCDYDADGKLDLIVGIGYWGDYGWDNAFNSKGEWTRGPLHGYVYLVRNTGTTKSPKYAEPVKINAAGKPIDVYGMPSPNLADYDNDGDLDIMCGEFLDKFTYFENIGSRSKPEYANGRLLTHSFSPITMDLQMIVPVAIDWDKDGDVDIIAGDEDGRVAFIENSGVINNSMPKFMPPRYFQQQAKDVKFGALVTPFSCDWDNDGDEDLICGNTAGYIGFIENLDGAASPKWAKPVYLQANGKIIRIQAGYNGSIQGPCEAKWGYTTLNVADWDHDGLLDILVNSIWGKVVWFKNIGTKENPKLAEQQPITVDWQGTPPKPAWNWWKPAPDDLSTQWRTTPVVIDWDKDGLNDLVMLDHEGYLAFFKRISKDGQPQLLPGERIFKDADTDELLRLNIKDAGGSGRRKLCFTDWDHDGKLDLMANSKTIDFWKYVKTENGFTYFSNKGLVLDIRLAGHSTSPTIVNWDKKGANDLLIGAEDGFFYFLPNPFFKK